MATNKQINQLKVKGVVYDLAVAKDWNESDKTGTSYIQNRTHFIDPTQVNPEIIFEEFQLDGKSQAGQLACAGNWHVGETLQITIASNLGDGEVDQSIFDSNFTKLVTLPSTEDRQICLTTFDYAENSSPAIIKINWQNPNLTYEYAEPGTFEEVPSITIAVRRVGIQQLAASFIPTDNETIKVDSQGKLNIQDTTGKIFQYVDEQVKDTVNDLTDQLNTLIGDISFGEEENQYKNIKDYIDANERDTTYTLTYAEAETTEEGELPPRIVLTSSTGEVTYIDAFQKKGTIVDVVTLPTSDIDTEVTYRVLKGTFILNKLLRNDSTCYIVEWDTVPTEAGESVFHNNNGVFSYTGYYNTTNDTVYGYFSNDTIQELKDWIEASDLNTALKLIINGVLNSMSAGWKTMQEIVSSVGSAISIKWGGVVTSKDSITDTAALYLYLSSKMFSRQNDSWISDDNNIGTRGEGIGAEVFNSLDNIATGMASHAEGNRTSALGLYTHAEGYEASAEGYVSHAEGGFTSAGGEYSHAEGFETTASGARAHAEGANTTAGGSSAHAEGSETKATAPTAHAEGHSTEASGSSSHAEGSKTNAIGDASHAEGVMTTASEIGTHAEGGSTTAEAAWSHAEGYSTTASGNSSHTEGQNTTSSGTAAHAEGMQTQAVGEYSHAEGAFTDASGQSAHAEGENTKATEAWSHAEGYKTEASNVYAHAEGALTVASGTGAHTEGGSTKATEAWSHAEGYGATASGNSSHAEGQNTTASGMASHAEGYNTVASGAYSHASGMHTTASGEAQTVIGKYNSSDPDAAFIIGCGSGVDIPVAHQSGWYNAMTVDWAGNANFRGRVTIGYDSLKFNQHVQTLATLEEVAASYTVAGQKEGTILGNCATAEGIDTTAFGAYSHAEGNGTTASDTSAHAEGGGTTASGTSAHAEGGGTTASGIYAHAEGMETIASGGKSHAEGSNTTASGDYSHAEGIGTEAIGKATHASGFYTKAVNDYSSAHGKDTFTAKDSQFVIGAYNKEDKESMFVVGCGHHDVPGVDEAVKENCFATGKDSNNNHYIKVGETKLTENQLKTVLDLMNSGKLQKMIDFIDSIEV